MNPATLPAWLAARPPVAGPCPLSGQRQRASFAERTLLGVTAFAAGAVLDDESASRPGALQALDPRAKVVSCVALLLGVALARSPWAIAAVALLALVLAAASRLDLGRFVARVWGVVPLFTAAVALPAALNVVTPGAVVLDLGATPRGLVDALRWPERLAVTAPGLEAAARLVLRAGASLSLVALVALTTRPGEALKALRALGVPRAFVLVAAVAHRYLGVLVTTIEEMHLALVSRRLRPLSAQAGRAFVTSRMGTVLEKSRATADAVHQAMVARGFRGELVTLAEPRLRAQDGLVVAAALLVATLLALGAWSHP